jgi:hypothetical protein
MSWSISVKGRDPQEVEDNLAKAIEGTDCPQHVTAAINESVLAFGANPEVEREFYVSSNGHINEGQGTCSISISVTNKPIDASTAEGARALADRLHDAK